MSEKWGRRLLVPFIFGAFLLMGTLEEVLAQDENVGFSWVLPVVRADNTALDISEILRTEIVCDGELVVATASPNINANGYLVGGSHDCVGFVFATANDLGGGEISSAASDNVVIVVPVKLSKPLPVGGFTGSLL